MAFGGWTDAEHGWVAPGLTPSSRYFALIHARDNLFTVISTAGEAALAVSDPSTNATGRLVNGALSLSEPLQAKAGGGCSPARTVCSGVRAVTRIGTYCGSASRWTDDASM